MLMYVQFFKGFFMMIFLVNFLKTMFQKDTY